MSAARKSVIPALLDRSSKELLSEWSADQAALARGGAIKESEIRQQCEDFLRLLRDAAASGNLTDVSRPEWAPMRDLLASVSRSRGAQGFSPVDTASFVFSLKRPLFARLRTELARDGEALADETWTATTLLLTSSASTPPRCTRRRASP